MDTKYVRKHQNDALWLIGRGSPHTFVAREAFYARPVVADCREIIDFPLWFEIILERSDSSRGTTCF